METVIREYHKSDREACMEAFRSNVPLYFTEDEVVDFENFLLNYERKIADGILNQTYFYVVENHGKVIGCGGFGDKDGKRIVSLAWGLIHKDFHKQGFGKALLDFRLAEIRKHFPGWPLVIDTTQFSYGFFEKCGFQTTKITNDYYTTGMHRYDMAFTE